MSLNSTYTKTLNDFAAECHADNDTWWRDLQTGERIERNKGELLMLVVSEIAEAMEGERKGLMDDKLPHRLMAEVELADAIIRILDYAGAYSYPLERMVMEWSVPDNKGEALLGLVKTVGSIHYEEEIFADDPLHSEGMGKMISIFIGFIEDYARKFGYDVWAAVEEKRAYNKQRADHKPENRIKAGGKKF